MSVVKRAQVKTKTRTRTRTITLVQRSGESRAWQNGAESTICKAARRGGGGKAPRTHGLNSVCAFALQIQMRMRMRMRQQRRAQTKRGSLGFIRCLLILVCLSRAASCGGVQHVDSPCPSWW